MKKIRLELERLHVESFDVTPSEPPARGTVLGQWSQPGTCDGFVASCQPGGTCAVTCARGCTGAGCL